MDSFQAIYEAVRSRISGCDLGSAVERAVRDQISGAQHEILLISAEISRAALEYQRPSAVYRPVLSLDGGQWCALYGNNLQEGVAGFGNSPAEAMQDFDENWTRSLIKTDA